MVASYALWRRKVIMKVKVGTHREKWGVQRLHPSISGESGYDFELIPHRSQKVGYPQMYTIINFGCH